MRKQQWVSTGTSRLFTFTWEGIGAADKGEFRRAEPRMKEQEG